MNASLTFMIKSEKHFPVFKCVHLEVISALKFLFLFAYLQVGVARLTHHVLKEALLVIVL